MININIENMYIGSVQVEKCYLGDKQIWPLGGKTEMTWDTTKVSSIFGQLSQDDEILLPLTPDGAYNFDVVYKGNVIKTITNYQDNLVQFPDGQGVKEIEIVGHVEGFSFYYGFDVLGDPAKLIGIESVGDDFKLMEHEGIFVFTENLASLPENWDLGITKTINMFQISAFNGNISGWDVSGVIDMSGMFQSSEFNGDISMWDVSGVTNMTDMFVLSQFNQDISAWDVSSVTNMDYMFTSSQFNQDLSSWCVSQISSKPSGFDDNTPQWTLPKPIWGTCPQ